MKKIWQGEGINRWGVQGDLHEEVAPEHRHLSQPAGHLGREHSGQRGQLVQKP